MGIEQYLSNRRDREAEIERLVLSSFQRVSEHRLRPQSLSGHLVIAETVLTESAESVFTKFIGRVNNIQIELCNSELSGLAEEEFPPSRVDTEQKINTLIYENMIILDADKIVTITPFGNLQLSHLKSKTF